MSAIFGETLTFTQADGTSVRLQVFGDEIYARYEDLNGYAVIYDDELGVFCYARLAAGQYRSTGVEVGDPPPRGLPRHLQESPEVIRAKSTAEEIKRAAPSRRGASDEIVRTFGPNHGLLQGRVLAAGDVLGLTIMVNFADLASTVTRADLEAMLNGENYTRNGNICSAREYFRRVSSGKLNYRNVVVGPYTLSRNKAFYVNNLLVEEALQLAVDDGLDLRQFDSLNENTVDALNVLYAGQTEYRGNLWPHNFHIDLQHGDIHTDLYLLTSLGRTAADLSIGTFCHENGHLLCRFPDMYDYGERDGDTMASAGIGTYCLMGSGNHRDRGRSPSPVCAYLRDLVGWCENETDLSVAGTYSADHGDYNRVLKFRTNKPNEYFLIENRSKIGLDRANPSSGLAVYHCDTLGSNELQMGTPTKHYQCALLQADGEQHLELNANTGDGADLFGAVAGTALSSESRPHSREWDGRESGLVVTAISLPGQQISFRVGGDVLEPGNASGSASPNLAIPDNNPIGVSSAIAITAEGSVATIKVDVDIRHTYRGDLLVTITSPTGHMETLHAQTGQGADNLIAIYDSASAGVLAGMVGQSMKGDWVLNVSDRVARDRGRLRSWSLALTSRPIGVLNVERAASSRYSRTKTVNTKRRVKAKARRRVPRRAKAPT